MGAAVAETDQRVGGGHHLPHHVEVAAGEVGDRQIEDAPAVVFHQHVVDHLSRRAALACGDRGDALVRRRLVVGRIAQRVHAVPALDPFGAAL
jgi:hypothetical protein